MIGSAAGPLACYLLVLWEFNAHFLGGPTYVLVGVGLLVGLVSWRAIPAGLASVLLVVFLFATEDAATFPWLHVALRFVAGASVGALLRLLLVRIRLRARAGTDDSSRVA